MPNRVVGPPRGIVRRPRATAGTHHARLGPAPDLAPFVEHVWIVRWDLRVPELVETLPHPAVHVVLERGAPSVVGPARRRFERRLEGASEVVGIKFRPGGFRPFAPWPVVHLVDRRLPLASLGPPWPDLEARVLDARTDEARVSEIEAFLRALRPARDRLADDASRLVDLAREDPSIRRVDDLARAARTTERTLQRLFRAYVGVSPKWVIQRYRLHEALARLEGGRVDGAALALELGYTDQAHFIRDFRALVGCTPAAYARGR